MPELPGRLPRRWGGKFVKLAAVGLLAVCPSLKAGYVFCADRSAGSSALIIGKLPIGSRAIALSGAYAAAAQEPAAVYWNAAGLARIERPRLEVLHIEHGEEIRTENLLYAQPVLNGGTAAASISFLSLPPIQETLEDESGEYLGEGEISNAYQFKAAGGYGQDLGRLAEMPWLGRIWENGLIGAAVTILGESVGDYGNYSASFDLGYIYEDANEGRSVGLTVRQLGFPASGSPLPITFQGGVVQVLGDLSIMADLLTASDDAFRIRGAVEWSRRVEGSRLKLRFGAQHSFSSSLLAPYAGGLSYEFVLPGTMDLELEYAYAPVEGFQPMHALSLNLGL